MSGKTVLITGCSRGIGLGLAKEFSARGYKVFATCLSPGKASDLNDFLLSNYQISALEMDVNSPESVNNCKSQILSHTDSLNVLVNNAGITNKTYPDDPATSTDPTEFSNIIQTNVTSILSVTQAFLPLLKEDSKVVNISSGLASLSQSPSFSTTAYQCSKTAMNMLTKCFADEVKTVTFLSIFPCWVQKDAPIFNLENSVKGIIDVCEQSTLKDSGKFMGFDGSVWEY